jgi:hypothetical protein
MIFRASVGAALSFCEPIGYNLRGRLTSAHGARLTVPGAGDVQDPPSLAQRAPSATPLGFPRRGEPRILGRRARLRFWLIPRPRRRCRTADVLLFRLMPAQQPATICKTIVSNRHAAPLLSLPLSGVVLPGRHASWIVQISSREMEVLHQERRYTMRSSVGYTIRWRVD